MQLIDVSLNGLTVLILSHDIEQTEHYRGIIQSFCLSDIQTD